MGYSKSDVEFHTSGGVYGPRYPAVNVKDYGNGGYNAVEHLVDKGVAQDVAERAVNQAIEWARDDFWNSTAPMMLEQRFGNYVKLYSAGRSGGWLIVEGLMDFEYWDALMLRNWQGFERDIKEECKWLMSKEQLLETVAINDLTVE